jgi:hypothetical protein
MLPIILTAITTFIITALWSRYSKIKGYYPLYVNFSLLLNELNLMAKKLGEDDLYNYWIKTKGKEYADTGMKNIKNTLEFLKDK